HALDEPLTITPENLGKYLGVDTLQLESNIDYLQFARNISIAAGKDSSGNSIPDVFGEKFQILLHVKDVDNPQISTTVDITGLEEVELNIGDFAGKRVVIQPEIQLSGMDFKELAFGVGDVYVPVSGLSKNALNTLQTAGQTSPQFRLESNFPNPFNPATTIRYHLAEPAKVKLVIYNLLGQPVKTLVKETLPAGMHRAIWDGTNDARQAVSSGTYFLRMTATSARTQFVDTQKLLFMK
ncbi:MAG: T9SS type A sorting domain-containing protein, partial [candidate division Zixibacteria bacterium]|nr:T9SS type A sorting domain-containing protein [candidate division Zixibacteria bacterium]